MIRIGLTGSMGTGKSETARMFAAEGIPVFDADAEVHRLYGEGETAALVAAAFPDAVRGGRVDRARLSDLVTRDPSLLPRLERLVHPLVERARRRAVEEAEASGAAAIVLDIPLLFETGRASDVDVVVVATAPPETARARVLARPGMTQDKFEVMRRRQMPDEEKRRRADYVVYSDRGFAAARRQVRGIIASVKRKGGP